jgi:preprotein translocase subunit Sec63
MINLFYKSYENYLNKKDYKNHIYLNSISNSKILNHFNNKNNINNKDFKKYIINTHLNSLNNIKMNNYKYLNLIHSYLNNNIKIDINFVILTFSSLFGFFLYSRYKK